MVLVNLPYLVKGMYIVNPAAADDSNLGLNSTVCYSLSHISYLKGQGDLECTAGTMTDGKQSMHIMQH